MSMVNYYQSAFNLQKEKTMYIGRNAQNLKKLAAGPVVAHYHYKGASIYYVITFGGIGRPPPPYVIL